ncbi:response regulator transcription factor [Chryseobacterium luquanense]|uniref:Helix-turn-helix transcriptional regulator n=1 Tax=Chryseobacterium luquanense TaxID=2983766 RepID=A0ABT3Y3I8_9FLAO|nr:helix-turn-helix transcriptional regulator [Chryseobacterium luquanense]MCX8532708.1 helix-turn-helix transcriptional regulator [Chryseobacterium luquanense]
MKKSEENHPLIEIWKTFPGARNFNVLEYKVPPIERIIGEMFSVGEFYYYVLNLTDSTLTNHHENILKMHGLKKYPSHLKEIIDLIHPDDLPFVIKAEQTIVEKMVEIGSEHQLFLKPSYCFRMRTRKGNYELFHHQAIHTLENESSFLIQSVNIHTNIQHITSENSFIVLLTGIGSRKDFHQFKIEHNLLSLPDYENELTKRENEVLSLIAKGYSGKEISTVLVLSEHTVRTHRRNILKKTGCRNSKELVKKAFDLGLI